MTEEIEKILQNAEELMKEGYKKIVRGEYRKGPRYYLPAIWRAVKALYEQNKAIIELLKEYKK